MAKDKAEPYHKEDLRADLLRAAEEELAERGAAGFSLRSAAQRAGVSHAAPYRHFGSKEELLAELLLDGFIGLTRALAAADEEATVGTRADGAAGGGSLAKVLAQCRAYLEFARGEPGKLELMFSSLGFAVMRDPAVAAEAVARRAVDPAALDAFAVLERRVEACVAEGVFDRRATPRAIAMVLWAGVHGIAVLEQEGVIRDMAADRGLGEAEALEEILAAQRLMMGHAGD